MPDSYTNYLNEKRAMVKAHRDLAMVDSGDSLLRLIALKDNNSEFVASEEFERRYWKKPDLDDRSAPIDNMHADMVAMLRYRRDVEERIRQKLKEIINRDDIPKIGRMIRTYFSRKDIV